MGLPVWTDTPSPDGLTRETITLATFETRAKIVSGSDHNVISPAIYKRLRASGDIDDSNIMDDEPGHLIVQIPTEVFGAWINMPYFVEDCDEPCVFGTSAMSALQIQLDYANKRILCVTDPASGAAIMRPM